MCKYLVYIVDHQRSPGIHEVTRRWQLAFGECRKYIQQKLLAKRNEDPGWTIGMIRRGWQGAGGRVRVRGARSVGDTRRRRRWTVFECPQGVGRRQRMRTCYSNTTARRGSLRSRR